MIHAINIFIVTIIVFCSVASSAESYIVLLGAPGSGKGTQAALLKEATGYPVFAIGNTMRAEKTSLSDFAKVFHFAESSQEARTILKFGYMIQKMAHAPRSDVVILESWPKSKLSFDLVQTTLFRDNQVIIFELVTDRASLLDRSLKRTVCENHLCAKSYGLVQPKISGLCDDCGSKTIKRNGDNTQHFTERLARYFGIVRSDFHKAFTDAGYSIHPIDAMQSAESTHTQIMTILHSALHEGTRQENTGEARKKDQPR